MPDPLNLEIAARFDEVAQLLGEQEASRYRVEAYRRGAETLRGLSRPVSAILHDEGLEGLERLPAIGAALARAIRAVVETGRLPMLDRLRGEADPVAAGGGTEPPVADLLAVDREYRTLFSNTQRAHELGRTRDWVVLYVDGARGERRYTVVTAPRGVMQGRRVVRGREAECLAHYRQHGLRLPAGEPDFVEA